MHCFVVNQVKLVGVNNAKCIFVTFNYSFS